MIVDGDDVRRPPGPATGWARLRRPDRMVGQTRWLFTLLLMGSVLVCAPGLVVASEPGERVLAAVAFVGLFAVWSYRYVTERAPVPLGVVEAALILATATAAVDPAGVFTYVPLSLWLRAVYGSTRGVFLHAGLVCTALLASLWTWTLPPGRPDVAAATSTAGIISAVPSMLLITWVARHLVRSLFAREETQSRDAALLDLSNRLIGVTDRAEIARLRDRCADALLAATPHLRVLAVVEVDGDRLVTRYAAGSDRVPGTLPRSVLPVDHGGRVAPLPDSRPLAGAAVASATWLGVPVADDAGWFLLAFAPRVCTESVVAVGSMGNQVALALRTSDAHHDLVTQAAEDPLTGLANRAAFTAALEAAVDAGDRRLALLFLDLDDFKLVNDGLGHAAGDDLLRHVAARLCSGVRPGDLCARLGGDEFAVLLFDAGDDATSVGQRLVELVSAPVTLRGRLAQVGASVGLAYAGAGLGGDQLVQRADVAMYAAKAKGKNRVQVFDPGLLQEDGRAQFEAELAGAAAAGQLVVHYQPIVAVDGGACVAVEALVRWQHPDRGLLYPAEFIPAAERTGAIVDVGEAVLRRACADACEWSDGAGPLMVHVNVSAAQLTDPGFLDLVRSCLDDAGMDPSRLVLEVTEGMVLDSPSVRAALEALSATGPAVALDDFGTGYSALNILRTLPVDIVKIDKSFLHAGPSRSADEVILEAVVGMTRRLGLRIVVEGVERVDQQQFLREVGADAAQGHLHLRPVPADVLCRYLARDNRREGRGGRDDDAAAVVLLGARRSG